MELVRDDGSAVELKERQRLELGRAAGNPKLLPANSSSELDTSVSRHHVILDLLRPSSRKGKEAAGEFPALKLHLQVIGRNPICIVRKGGLADEKDGERVKLVRTGESDWLAPGDKFTLSIKKPAYLILRQCLSGSVGPHSREESLCALRNASPVGMETVVQDDEEKGIAEAVARRTRRRLDRNGKKQTTNCDEKKQEPDDAINGECDTVKPDVYGNDVGNDRQPRKPNSDLQSFDPVRDFGFVKEGSEFHMYEKHRHFKNVSDWSWNIGKKGGDDDEGEAGDDEELSEDGSEEEIVDQSNGSTPKKKRPPPGDGNDDEDWGGDSKEEGDRVAAVAGKTTKRKVATRSTDSAQQKSSNRKTLGETRSTGSRNPKPQDSGDLDGFVVSDEDSGEEEDDEEDEWDVDEEDADADDLMDEEGEDDLIDDDGPAARKTKRKLACKFGSNCYRKNKEHLEQFSHPPK